MLKALFIGVVLTATSVSITVETLREMGRLKGKVGTAILGAAIIDDIMGIIVLTLVSAMTDPTVQPIAVLGRIVAFFILVVIVGFVMYRLFRAITNDHVRAAIAAAEADFEEGDVGAGKGTGCFGMKGGIGSASRLMELGGETYTLGVLVQTNFDHPCVWLCGQLPQADEGAAAGGYFAHLPSGDRMTGRVHSFQSMGAVDGPGVRFVVFLQGYRRP